jgi:hypothetical protein
MVLSRDGRYVVLDDAVVDVDRGTKVPLDCDIRDMSFADCGALACRSRDGRRVNVVSGAGVKALPCSSDSGVALDATCTYLLCPDPTPPPGAAPAPPGSLIIRIDTGQTEMIPGNVVGLPLGGDAGVAWTSLDSDSMLLRYQLWDFVRKAPVGRPYETDLARTAWSPDGRWHFGTNERDGQFIVDARSGTRRTVGRAAAAYSHIPVDLQPF